jgi:hypothetical protein
LIENTFSRLINEEIDSINRETRANIQQSTNIDSNTPQNRNQTLDQNLDQSNLDDVSDINVNESINLHTTTTRNAMNNTVRNNVNTSSRNLMSTPIGTRTPIERNNDSVYDRILSNVNNNYNSTRNQNTWTYNSYDRDRYTGQRNYNRQFTSMFDNIDNLLNTPLTDFLEPVVIRPNDHQIEISTHRTAFSNIIRPVNTRCPITLSEFSDDSEVIMIIHCGHLFSPDELLNWFASNVRCPICRFDIRNHNHIRGANNNIQSNISDSEITIPDVPQDEYPGPDTPYSSDSYDESSEELEENGDIDLTHELYNDLYQNIQEELP